MSKRKSRGSDRMSRHLSGRATHIPPRVVRSITGSVTVTDQGCWEPNGSINAAGYHRRSWSDAKGRHYHLFCHQIMARVVHLSGLDLAPGELVHHTCGNKRCSNPLHLEVLKNSAEHAEVHRRRA